MLAEKRQILAIDSRELTKSQQITDRFIDWSVLSHGQSQVGADGLSPSGSSAEASVMRIFRRQILVGDDKYWLEIETHRQVDR